MNLLNRAYIAKHAYIEDKQQAKKALEGFLDIRDMYFLYVPKTDTESYIIRHNDNDCIIALAGTGSLKDFKYDAFFIPNKYKKGYVHYGFLKIVSGMRTEVNKKLLKMFPSGIDHIDIIGHSLGAAEACLLIDEISKIYNKNQVTCFGCPNGFSKKARLYLEQYNIHQVKNNFDYVTMMLGITSGKPSTKNTKVNGPWGHFMNKYIKGVERLCEE